MNSVSIYVRESQYTVAGAGSVKLTSGDWLRIMTGSPSIARSKLMSVLVALD